MVERFISALETSIINPILALLFVAGLMYFIWGLIQFILSLQGLGGGKIEDGKKHMVWGAVGMFIMASVRGIISIVQASINSL